MSQPVRPHPPLDPDNAGDADMLAGALAAALTPIEPDAARRGALRRRLLDRARASRDGASRFINVRREDGKWRALAAGVRVKLLNEHPTARSVLVELEAGASLPKHRHHELEECVVLRGEAQLGELIVRRGDYHVASAGSRHGRVSSRTGALLYLRGVPIGNTVRVARDLVTAWLPGEGAAPVTVRADEGTWQELAPGVRTKPLWSDGAESSMLVRIEPGARVSPHAHLAHEECLMIEGEAFLGDTLLRAGDYQFGPAGSAHEDVESDIGALLYVHGAASGDLSVGACR